MGCIIFNRPGIESTGLEADRALVEDAFDVENSPYKSYKGVKPFCGPFGAS